MEGFFRGDHSPTATSAPSLRPARPERIPDKFSSSRYPNHPKFFLYALSLLHTTVGTITHGVAGDPTLPGSYPVHNSFSVSEGATIYYTNGWSPGRNSDPQPPA
jgi:hypothetical protein